MKLLFLLVIIIQFSYADEASDYITSLQAREDENAILNSDKYQQCYNQHKNLEETDISQFNDNMNKCIIDTISSASKEELESVASSMSLRSFDFEKTKTSEDLKEYLSARIYNAIHGENSYENKKIKEMKFVDQRIFFDLYEAQIHKNIMLEFAKYCLENVGYRKNNDIEDATYFLSFEPKNEFAQNVKEGKASIEDIKKIKYYNVANRDSNKAADQADKYKKSDTFENLTLEGQPNFSASQFSSVFKEYNYCAKTVDTDEKNPCHEKNARSSGLVKLLKEFELNLGKVRDSEGKIGQNLQRRFLVCSKLVIPTMCEAFRCRNTYDWTVAINEDTFVGKKLKFCKEKLGIDRSANPSTPSTNKEGKIACNLVNKIVDYKKTLDLIKAQKENLANDFQVGKGYNLDVAFKKGKYQGGRGDGEKSIDEITSISSKEISTQVDQISSNSEVAQDLRERCIDDNGQLLVNDPECQNLDVDIDALRKARFQAEAEKEAYLRRVREFQQNGGTDEDLKGFLIDNGLAENEEAAEEMIQNMSEEEVLSIVENKYKSDREAIISNMNDKLYEIINKSRNEVVRGDFATDQINELEDNSQRIETLFNYTNIVTSYVSLEDQNSGTVTTNSRARRIESEGYDEFAEVNERQQYEEFFDDNEGVSDSDDDGPTFYSTETLINDIGDFATAE